MIPQLLQVAILTDTLSDGQQEGERERETAIVFQAMMGRQMETRRGRERGSE